MRACAAGADGRKPGARMLESGSACMARLGMVSDELLVNVLHRVFERRPAPCWSVRHLEAGQEAQVRIPVADRSTAADVAVYVHCPARDRRVAHPSGHLRLHASFTRIHAWVVVA